jgi:hypothetical protein
MAAGAKLFVNTSSTGHRAISNEHCRREVAVGGRSRLLGEIQLSLYLREDGGDIGDYHKKDGKGELLKHRI